LAIVIVVELPA